MAKKLIVFTLILVFSASPLFAELTTQQLADRLLEGQKAFYLELAERDKAIAEVQKLHLLDIEEQRRIRNIQNEFLQKSREIHLKYREPFVRRVIAETNATLPEGKKINTGLGSDIYERHPVTGKVIKEKGKKVINTKHRGWQGDLDLGGDPRSAEKLKKTFKKYGVHMTSDTMGGPGYRDFKQIEVTINIEGRMDKPGSSTHLTQVQLDAFSKETYVSVGMKKGQAGMKLVETNDHFKKGIKGIIADPAKLVAAEGEGLLQGTAKGTLKSMDSGNITDSQLRKILDQAGYQGRVKNFKEQIEFLKEGHIAPGVGLNERNVKSFQNACKNTMEQAVKNAEKTAAREIKDVEAKIKELEAKADSPKIPKDQAELYKRQAQKLREDLADSKIRIDQTKLANKEKLKGGSYSSYYERTSGGKERLLDDLSKKPVSSKMTRMDAIKKGLKPDTLSVVGYGMSAKAVYDTYQKYKSGKMTKNEAVIEITGEVVDTGFGMVTDVASAAAVGTAATGGMAVAATVAAPIVITAAATHYLTEAAKESLRLVEAYKNEEIANMMAKSKLQEAVNTFHLEVDKLLKKGTLTGDWGYFAGAEHIVDRLENMYTITGEQELLSVSNTLSDRINSQREALEKEHGCSIYALKDKLEKEGIAQQLAIAMGPIQATLKDYNGPLLGDAATVGHILAFKVDRRGLWADAYKVQWFVNGQLYKEKPATDPKIHRLKFDSGPMAPGYYKVAVRAMLGDKLAAYQEVAFNLAEKEAWMAADGLPAFEIKGARDTYGGPPISGPVANGDILAFEAHVAHPKSEPPLVTTLFWQVYDAEGKPLPGLKKDVQAFESDKTKAYRFRFRLDRMDNGEYTVGLTHFLTSDPAVKAQAVFPFKVFQAVRIERLVVCDNLEAKKHMPTLNPDQVPHLFAYYRLADGVDTVKADLKVKDAETGMLISQETVDRPRKSDTPTQRVGYRLPEGMLKTGLRAVFEVSLTSPDGKVQTSKTTFEVVPYQITLTVPESLKSGQSGRFEIRVPESFKPPFLVDFDVSNGLSVNPGPEKLSGSVTGITSEDAITSQLYVSINDTEGRSAKAVGSIHIEPVALAASVSGVSVDSHPTCESVKHLSECAGIVDRYLAYGNHDDINHAMQGNIDLPFYFGSPGPGNCECYDLANCRDYALTVKCLVCNGWDLFKREGGDGSWTVGVAMLDVVLRESGSRIRNNWGERVGTCIDFAEGKEIVEFLLDLGVRPTTNTMHTAVTEHDSKVLHGYIDLVRTLFSKGVDQFDEKYFQESVLPNIKGRADEHLIKPIIMNAVRK